MFINMELVNTFCSIHTLQLYNHNNHLCSYFIDMKNIL